ncbi:C4-dicarboxylate ABC transporter permease [Tistrella bauzanensis]|uniref:TRAP transporter large permease protein n=1 Tax=Tistrella bauzanensis TaxID=657419 RepID=A0ABQ1IPC8_9PROT|nr:TRAP transporter large permease [Tistrella bauzanensis]GGB45342.1 C4-dicarboxylate ABC transporter permease [Tistrella bauzanensis]
MIDGGLAAIGGFVALFGLAVLRVPVGFAMLLAGLGGIAATVGVGPAAAIALQSPLRTLTAHDMLLIPMFIAMSALANHTGLGRELYGAGQAWAGHRRGGLGLATILASAGFAGICGSSVASTAAMARVALPEMRAHGYAPRLAAGTVAAGGTLGILIPPSLVLALYGLLTEQDIGKLFIAGLLPGLLAVVLYGLAVSWVARRDPGAAPRAPRTPWRGRLVSLRGLWAVLLIFAGIIGGLYLGVFAPSEAGAMGALGVAVVGLVRGRLDARAVRAGLTEAARTAASVMVVLIGALVFGYFLALTRAPQMLVAMLADTGLPPWGVMAAMLAGYLLLGCVLDTLAMIVLTVPITYPVAMALGFDPIWFGVVVTMTVEIGLITPPYGLNVLVLNTIARDVGLIDIYRGVAPFVCADLVRLILICLLPGIVLWLPSTMG